MRKSKKKNKLYLAFIGLGVVLITIGVVLLFNINTESTKSSKPNLKDDYYASINYGNIGNAFLTAQSETYSNVATLEMEIEKDQNFYDDNYFNFIETFEDIDTRDKNGINELKKYFDLIDNASTLDEFSDVLIDVNYELGVKSFINWEIGPNIYDNSKNVIMFEPMILENLATFTFDDTSPSGLDFFADEKYDSIKIAFEKARVSYFEQYGYDKEKAINLSNKITEFAKSIQDKSASLDELTGNYTKYYKNVTHEELKSIVKNLPIDKLLKKYNLNNYEYFAIFDEGHIKELDKYYTVEHLPLMKEILRLLILENIASLYSSSSYAQIFANCFSDLSGERLDLANLFAYYEVVKLKPSIMGSYFNVKYDEKYFTETEKLEIIELINKIKEHYITVIENSNWLDESTKESAIKKINNLKTNVGYVQKEEYPLSVKLLSKDNGGTILANYILMNIDSSQKMCLKIKDKYQLEIDHFTVNAYYNPTDNSINFPSSFREVYRNIKDKYEIYGYIGMTIAHEISHAFDNNGSLFDESGNYKNWWSEDDETNFNELKKKIVEYYSKYEMYGIKVDGSKTVGENIADLAAVNTILSIMDSENATKEDYIKFFESYAKLWNDNTPKELLIIQMASDSHSPNKIRVNAVLSSMDKFYDIYDIKESDKMYVAKENRVGLW